jgi:hypothetical protein
MKMTPFEMTERQGEEKMQVVEKEGGGEGSGGE